MAVQRGIISGGRALYYNGQFVVVPGSNFGPLPMICNGVTIPTNADQQNEMTAFALNAQKYDPPSTMYNVEINNNRLVLTQAQMFDLFGL